MLSWIIISELFAKAEGWGKWFLRDNLWHHVKIEFNNCYILQFFENNWTEYAKVREQYTDKGLGN